MKVPYQFIPNLESQVEDIPENSIVSKTIKDSDTFKATLFGFATGQSLSEHSVTQDALLYFISGEMQLTLGQDTMTTQPGTWVHMPPDLTHSLTANTPTHMLLIILKRG